MEIFGDQIYTSWRRNNSVDLTCHAGTRTSRYPGAWLVRILPSEWRVKNRAQATRRSCCWQRDCQRDGLGTGFPSIHGRKGNDNQTLVGAGRPPPTAGSRRSNIDVGLPVLPRPGRCDRRSQDQRHLPRLLTAARSELSGKSGLWLEPVRQRRTYVVPTQFCMAFANAKPKSGNQ